MEHHSIPDKRFFSDFKLATEQKILKKRNEKVRYRTYFQVRIYFARERQEIENKLEQKVVDSLILD